MTEMQRIMPIQYLRGVAAMAVVLAHITSNQRPLLGESSVVVPDIIGVWGVDIFFVISGFIIVYITKNIQPGLSASRNFLCKRIIRIVPAYWFFTILVFFMGKSAIFGNPESSKDTVMMLVKSLLFIKPGFPVLFVGWTLTLEMLFYLVFASGMLLFKNKGRIVFACCFFVFLVILPFLIDSEGRYLKFYAQAILLEFSAGMLIAGSYEYVRSAIKKELSLIILFSGCLLLLFFNCFFDVDLLTRNRALFWGVPAVLIVFGMLHAQVNGAFKIFCVLGSISYSLYLCHMICVYAVARIVVQLAAGNGWVYLVVTMMSSLALAAVSYLFFEKYLDGKLRKLFVHEARNIT